MSGDFDLSGRVAVVTGGGRSIGLAAARALAGAGAAVVVAEVDPALADGAAATLREHGARALAVPTDVARSDRVQQMIDRALEAFGRLDILVNNAGVTSTYHSLDLPEAEWDRVLGVNLKGVFLCSQAAARVMATAGGGAIVNVSSQLGDVARPGKAHYCAAKGGVKMLTKALAVDLAPHGIRVNAVAPGPVETDLTAPLLADPAQRAAFLAHLPLGRFGQPDEIAGAILYLASDAARFVTGTTLYVDGGYTAM